MYHIYIYTYIIIYLYVRNKILKIYHHHPRLSEENYVSSFPFPVGCQVAVRSRSTDLQRRWDLLQCLGHVSTPKTHGRMKAFKGPTPKKCGAKRKTLKWRTCDMWVPIGSNFMFCTLALFEMYDEKKLYVFKETGICTLGNCGKYHCQNNRWHSFLLPQKQSLLSWAHPKSMLNHVKSIFPTKFKKIHEWWGPSLRNWIHFGTRKNTLKTGPRSWRHNLPRCPREMTFCLTKHTQSRWKRSYYRIISWNFNLNFQNLMNLFWIAGASSNWSRSSGRLVGGGGRVAVFWYPLSVSGRRCHPDTKARKFWKVSVGWWAVGRYRIPVPKNTFDGSFEIRRSPVEVDSLSDYFQGCVILEVVEDFFHQQ